MDHEALANKESLDTAVAAMKENLFQPEVVATGAEALARIKEIIPAGASVMNGASKTLDQIGYLEYLKAGRHGWNNLHEAILAEKDPAKQSLMRKQLAPDFWLNSVHGITEKGELVDASASGSQMPALAFTANSLIIVASTKKIVPDIAGALQRIDEHVVPLEDVRMKQVYGPESGTKHAKTLILHR